MQTGEVTFAREKGLSIAESGYMYRVAQISGLLKIRKPEAKPFEIEHKMARARYQNAEDSPAALGLYPVKLVCFGACHVSSACGAKDFEKQCQVGLTQERWTHRKNGREAERKMGIPCS